jgi:colicin import membrane protein
MKKFVVLFLFSGLGLFANGQTAGDATMAAIDAERQQITAERLKLEEAFDAEDAVCYTKFFVNSCLNAVKPRRREAMAGLKQREVALNEQERRQKAADQIRKTEEKSSPEVLQQAAERRTQALEDTKEREERTRNKAEERGALQQKEALNANEAANKLQGSKDMARARAEKQTATAEEVKKFNAKQQEALERKASREKKQREQTKAPAAPLPAPK